MAGLTLPAEVITQMFGRDRDPQEAADDRFQHEHMLRSTTRWLPDLGALRSMGGRIVVGIGEASRGLLIDRTSRALAAALGIAPTMFPGGHIALVENPDRFAAHLPSVLSRR